MCSEVHGAYLLAFTRSVNFCTVKEYDSLTCPRQWRLQSENAVVLPINAHFFHWSAEVGDAGCRRTAHGARAAADLASGGERERARGREGRNDGRVHDNETSGAAALHHRLAGRAFVHMSSCLSLGWRVHC